MSDEESFVILGSSPNSIENFSLIQKESSLSAPKDATDNGISVLQQSITKLDDKENSEISIDFKYSFVDNTSMNMPEANMPELNIARRLKRDSLSTSETAAQTNSYSSVQNSAKNSLNGPNLMSNSSATFVSNGISKPSAHQGTLAANFLMGDIDLIEMKEKFYSEFPSLSGSQIKNEDNMKLQNLWSEYIDLRETLKRNNLAWRQHFSIVQKWQDDNKIYKEEQKKQQIKLEEIIARLNNDNMQLRQDLESKIEHFQLNEESMRRDNDELKMKVSEQKSQIENMTIQIQKLEQQNLATFEYVPKKGEINDEQCNKNGVESEYISSLEHKRITKKFERELSVLTAKNYELEDMKQIYLDEINCLKVNLTAAEELLKKNQTDINVLKSKDTERTEFFENYQQERDEMKQNMELLKKQVEIYSNDFQIERTDRENMAKEKEQVLSEVKLLQRRNQQLIEEQQEANRRTEQINTPIKQKVVRTVNPEPFVCPLCNRTFNNLDTLQMHVQDCIDQ